MIDQDAGDNDAGADAAADVAADVAPVYPAFIPEMPKIIDQGGAKLTAPKIVTVTWNVDPNAATYEAFGDAIGPSNYWKDATKEYGIGAATNVNVRIKTAPPASMTDVDLDNLVSAQVAAAPGNGWPVADDQTLFIFYVPGTTAFLVQGKDACLTTSGFHDETTTAQNSHVVYAAVLQTCHDVQPVIEFSTETASHELIEEVTDPHIQTDLAWTGFDADHYAWELYVGRQDEVGDACQDMDDVYYTEASPLAYRVQRAWSNAAARAGHHPCKPAPTPVYFNGTPLDVEPVTFSLSTGKKITTKGYGIALGQTRTLRVGLYTDAPTDPWTVNVVEGDGFTPAKPARLTIVTKTKKGNNGDIILVDVTLNSIGKQTGVLATIVSTRGAETRGMPLLIAAK